MLVFPLLHCAAVLCCDALLPLSQAGDVPIPLSREAIFGLLLIIPSIVVVFGIWGLLCPVACCCRDKPSWQKVPCLPYSSILVISLLFLASSHRRSVVCHHLCAFLTFVICSPPCCKRFLMSQCFFCLYCHCCQVPISWMTGLTCIQMPFIFVFAGLFFVFVLGMHDGCQSIQNVGATYLSGPGDDLCNGQLDGTGSFESCSVAKSWTVMNTDVSVSANFSMRDMYVAIVSSCPDGKSWLRPVALRNCFRFWICDRLCFTCLYWWRVVGVFV